MPSTFKSQWCKIVEIQFQSELHTMPVPRDTEAPWLDKDTDKVKLTQDLRVVLNGILIIVPKGYITDGASVPRFFWRLYNPWCTEARRASCVHDFFYSHLYKSFDKKFADEALREIMKHDKASSFMAWVFYRAVRLNVNGGGWSQ